jgi:hypothetical protein
MLTKELMSPFAEANLSHALVVSDSTGRSRPRRPTVCVVQSKVLLKSSARSPIAPECRDSVDECWSI